MVEMVDFHVDGVHHITLRVPDLERSCEFYEKVMGLELDQDLPGKIRFRLWPGAGATRLVLKDLIPGTPDGDRFTKRRVGLDHVSLGCSRKDLDALVEGLSQAGVATKGIQAVRGGGSRVAFRDPDNIQWEFFSD